MGAGYKSLFQAITHQNKATSKARVLGSITPKGAGAQHYGNCLEKMEERRETKYNVFSMASLSQALGHWKSCHGLAVLGWASTQDPESPKPVS